MDVVSRDLTVAAPHYTLIDCISLMLQNEIQHLPIGEWRQMSNAESDDERQGKTVTGMLSLNCEVLLSAHTEQRLISSI
jgi:hypothetical protein